jgi:hypothetical protein
MTNDNGLSSEVYFIYLAKLIGVERSLEIVAEEQAKLLINQYHIMDVEQFDSKCKVQIFMPSEDRELIRWYLSKE